MVYNPVCHQDQSLKAITRAEAEIAQCMAEFICCILEDLKSDNRRSIGDKVQLFKILIGASAEKENAIAAVLNALANKILAQRDICDIRDNCDN